MNIRLAYRKWLRILLTRVALGNRDGVVYSVALRAVRYEVTKKGRAVANAELYKEQAHWLVGDKVPHQEAN